MPKSDSTVMNKNSKYCQFSGEKADTLDFKLVILGEQGVGKSSLVHYFFTEQFMEYVESTIGASYKTKIIYVNEHTVKLEIWDTSGQERYRALGPMYYRRADAVFLVYDITRKKSFDELNYWVEQILVKHNINTTPVIFLIGNKYDLDTLSNRQVSKDMAERYLNHISTFYQYPRGK